MKLDVGKVIDYMTRGSFIPIDSVKSENYFGNYGYKIGGMGCIDLDKSNPVYLVGSYCKRPGWNYLNQIELVWNMLAQGYNHPFLVCFDDYKTY